MKQYLRPGRIMACILTTTLVVMLWGMVFEPGGLASNVLLGLVLAGMMIYYGTKNLGAFLDDLFFEGGSREKAFLMREARNELKLLREKLTKASKKRRAANEQAFVAFEKALNQLEEHVLNRKPDLKAVRRTLEHVDQTAKAFLKKLPRKGLLGGFESLMMALLGALALRVFLVEPFQIPSGSMIPTLLVGDHLFVSKLSYGIMNPFSREPSYLIRWASPKPGDVMIFEAPPYVPNNAGATWIKRVIAVGGQRIQVKKSVVYIDGRPYQHISENKLVHYYDYYMSYNLWREETALLTQEQVNPNLAHDIYMTNPDEDWPQAVQKELTGLTCNSDSCLVQEGYVFVMGDNRGGSLDSRCWGALSVNNIKGKALFIWMSVNGRNQMISYGRFALPEFRWARWFREIR